MTLPEIELELLQPEARPSWADFNKVRLSHSVPNSTHGLSLS
jgi:hypothetical protein